MFRALTTLALALALALVPMSTTSDHDAQDVSRKLHLLPLSLGQPYQIGGQMLVAFS